MTNTAAQVVDITPEVAAAAKEAKRQRGLAAMRERRAQAAAEREAKRAQYLPRPPGG